MNIKHSTPQGEHSSEDCPGGGSWPCNRQPATGSTLAADNDPVLIPVRKGPDKARAHALRHTAATIAHVFPLEANGLCNMADEMDPAGRAKPEDQEF